MSFLAPLFLVGAAAVALPIIFHLIRRTTRERMPFSSLMFLQPSPPRLTRRSRLEHLLLLALRCAVLCLLAIGFARPFLKKAVPPSPAATQARRMVVLVDTSASMRRGKLWAEAKSRAASVLRHASPADQVAIFTFDRQARPILTFEQWTTLPAGDRVPLGTTKLEEISPGSAGTHLGNALITAAEALADTEGKAAFGRREIVLISDLQEGSRVESLQGYEWPKGVELTLEQVKAPRRSNASLQLITRPDESGLGASGSVRVRVFNEAGSQREQFKVGWAQPEGRSFAGKPLELYVPAGQSRTVSIPVPATNAALAGILLEGDEEPFDNLVFATPPEQTRFNVIYWGTDANSNRREALFFLQRAFQQAQEQVVDLTVRSPEAMPRPSELPAAALLIVTSPLAETSAQVLHDQVTGGKVLLYAVSGQASGPTLARLLGLERLEIGEPPSTNYAMLGEIDFRHPLFAPFADPRYSDFTKIHFWKYCQVDAAAIPGARVLAKFDNGAPAFLEIPVGKGRVFVLASGWRPEESQLALSTKFVPLLYSFIELSGAPPPLPSQYYVDDLVPLSWAGADRGPLIVRTPDRGELKLAATETNFSQTMSPGIYSVISTQPARRFAVNLDPAESRTAPLAPEALERLGVPLTAQSPRTGPQEQARKTRLQNAELENRQKLWRLLIITALAVLFVETWVGRQAMQRNAASATQ
jgi:aerotolerance regulator-like protein/VWA domain-containing protein